MRHYLQCGVLWAAASAVSGNEAGASERTAFGGTIDSAERICLVVRLVCAYSLHHAVKGPVGGGSPSACTEGRRSGGWLPTASHRACASMTRSAEDARRPARAPAASRVLDMSVSPSFLPFRDYLSPSLPMRPQLAVASLGWCLVASLPSLCCLGISEVPIQAGIGFTLLGFGWGSGAGSPVTSHVGFVASKSAGGSDCRPHPGLVMPSSV